MASTRLRTITKAASWEFISNSFCFLLAILLFGGLGSCLLFTAVAIGIKLGLFYVHDRIWNRVQWGKK